MYEEAMCLQPGSLKWPLNARLPLAPSPPSTVPIGTPVGSLPCSITLPYAPSRSGISRSPCLCLRP